MAIEIPPKIKTNEKGLERLSEEERKIHLIMVPLYKKSAIPLSVFEGLYDGGMITKDATYVEEMEHRFKESEDPELAHFQRRAELLEALTREEIKNANWLGQEAKPITASRYDDIKNGVDLIIEFIKKEGISRLALSIDVTSNTTSLEQKLGKIKEGIMGGYLTKVKYFISSDGNRQEIRNVPKVVIGTDAALIRELSLLRLEVHTCAQALKRSTELGLSPESIMSIESRGKEARSKLARHRIQLLILDQIQLQLEIFIKFSLQSNRPQLVQEYQKALDVIKNVRKEKSMPGDKRSVVLSDKEQEENNNDGVYKALKTGLKIFD